MYGIRHDTGANPAALRIPAFSTFYRQSIPLWSVSPVILSISRRFSPLEACLEDICTYIAAFFFTWGTLHEHKLVGRNWEGIVLLLVWVSRKGAFIGSIFGFDIPGWFALLFPLPSIIPMVFLFHSQIFKIIDLGLVGTRGDYGIAI